MADFAYRKALAEGEMDVAYARIMFLGAAGVGKTSFKRSLMREPWNPQINSTIVSDVQALRPIGREWQALGHEEDEKWREVTEEDELNEMAELLAAVHQNRSSLNEFTSKVIAATKLFPDSRMIKTSSVSEKTIEEFEKSHVQDLLSNAIARANSIPKSSAENIKPQPFLHIWDCGGQPVFLEILPAFLTSRTMFLLLYDASKSFDEKWQSVQTVKGERRFEEEVDITTIDLLLNWLSNIHIHLAKYDEKGALVNYPRVLCVGTHGDKLKDMGQTHDQKIQEIESHCHGKPFEVLIDGFHIVDNTTSGREVGEDINFSKVRNAIRDFTYHKLIVKTPISWVLFRKVIQVLKANVITLEEAHAIGIACKIPSDVVPKVLLFYHDLGVLLFYPHITGLKNTVILNPRWFVDALGKVLTLKGREDHKTRLMWELLREKGILVQPLYVAAWREVEGLDPESLINLLVRFRLAAEVKTDQYHDPSVKQYFLPLVLPSMKGVTFPPGYRQKAAPLHLKFRTAFVPPGFFTRFIMTITESSQCKINFNKGVYRNRISIKFGNPPIDQVVLREIPHAIQVDILRYAPESDGLEKFSRVCQELHGFLVQAALKVDECLFGGMERDDDDDNESGKVFKEVRFVCAKPECQASGLHYLEHVKGHSCDLYLYCEKNDEYREVLHEEGLWFPDKSTSVNVIKKTSKLQEKEMILISKKISQQEKVSELAAHLEMTSNLNVIMQDSKRSQLAGFNLLYEWVNHKGGVRDELVEALKEINLPLLAEMVNEAVYDNEKLKKKKRQKKGQRTNAPDYSQLATSLSSSDVSQIDQQKSMKKTENISNEPVYEDVSHIDQQASVIEASRFEKTEPYKAPTLPPVTFVSDNDLVRCSRHINTNLSSLAGYLGISRANLQQIEYDFREVETQAYWVLKKWLTENQQINARQYLHDRLQILGLSEAAESLVNPEQSLPSREFIPPSKEPKKCSIM